jgi:predicted nucleotidyltransferase
MDPFVRIAAGLNDAGIRYVIIGVWGANYYARGTLFVTKDQDLLLPPDAGNLLRAWNVCEAAGLELMNDTEPLDRPRDQVLAEAVVRQQALTTATDGGLLHIDLSLVMTGFGFDEVSSRRRSFRVDGVELPVASLADIVAAKAAANRPKDRQFLTTNAAELKRLLGERGPRP